jgi:hypothetical protein
MFNPYVILTVLVLWGASLTGAYVEGGKNAHNADLAKTAQVQSGEITKSNADNLNNFNDEMQDEYRNQKRQASRQTHTRAVAVALAASSAGGDCKLSTPAYGVLRDSITASNADAASTAAVVDAPVRSGNGTIGSIVGYRLPGAKHNVVGSLHMPDEPSQSGGLGQ